MKKNTITLISITFMLIFSISFPLVQIQLYQNDYQIRYDIPSELALANQSTILTQEYLNYISNYLDSNDLISTPNSGGDEGNRVSYQIIESFRYLFCLLNTDNETNHGIANRILSKLLIIKEPTFGKPHSVSMLGSLESWGGFGWWWKEYSWLEEVIFSTVDSYATYHIIPYIVVIYNQFYELLTEENQIAMKKALRPLVTWLQNQLPFKEDPIYFVQKIQSLLMINSIIKSPYLERQAIDMFLHYSNHLLSIGRANSLTSHELQVLILSLRMIYDYASLDLQTIVNATTKYILSASNIPPLNQIAVNVSQRFYNPNFESELYYGKSLSSLAQEYTSQSVALDSSMFSSYPQNLLGHHRVFYMLILLLSAIGFYISFKRGETDKEERNIRIEVMRTNKFFEGPSIFINSGLALYIMINGNDSLSIYLFIFLWPLLFLYGLRKNQNGTVQALTVFGLLESSTVYSFLSFAQFNIISLFILVWILDGIHSAILANRFIRRQQVGEGANSPNLGYCLIYCIVFSVFFVFAFLLPSPFWRGAYYYMVLYFILKPAVLIRAKFG